MTTATTEHRVYVASLADYNAGRLHGRWIDATLGAEHIQSETAAMLKESREPFAEEWAIHDYEGFDGWKLGEWESFDTVAEVAAAMEAADDPAALGAWIANQPEYNIQNLDRFVDEYCGEWASGEEYAEQFYTETDGAEALGPLAMYIDWAHVWRDKFEYANTWSANAPGGIYVFEGS